MPYSARSKCGTGFTLIELLIVIAIIGILSTIIFSNFAQEKKRGDIKSAADALAADLQAMQADAQGGIRPITPPTQTVNGTVYQTTINGFGLLFTTSVIGEKGQYNNGDYVEFVDLLDDAKIKNIIPQVGPFFTPNVFDYQGDTSPNTDPTPWPIRTLPTSVVLSKISGLVSGTDTPLGRADIVFHQPSGSASLIGNGALFPTAITLTLKHTLLNICYSVTITQAGPTAVISKRQLVSCPS